MCSTKRVNGTSGLFLKTVLIWPFGATVTSPGGSLMRSPCPSSSRNSFQGLDSVGRPGPETGPKKALPLMAVGSAGDSTVTSPICEPGGQVTGSLLPRPNCASVHCSSPTPPAGPSVTPSGSVTSASLSCACQIGSLAYSGYSSATLMPVGAPA